MGGYEERIDWLVLAIGAIGRQCPRTQLPLADTAVALIDREPWLVDAIKEAREREILLWSHPEDIAGGHQAVEASISLLARGIELSLDGVELAAMMAARGGIAEALLARIEAATGRRFPDPPNGVGRAELRVLIVTCVKAAEEALSPLFRSAGRKLHGQRRSEGTDGESRDDHEVFWRLVSEGRSYLERHPDAEEAALLAHLRAKLRRSDEMDVYLRKACSTMWESYRARLDPRHREMLDLHERIRERLSARAPAQRLPAEMETAIDEPFLMGVTMQLDADSPSHRPEELARALCVALDRREALIRRAWDLGPLARMQLLLHQLEISAGMLDGLDAAIAEVKAAPLPATEMQPRRDALAPRRRRRSVFDGAVDHHLQMSLKCLKFAAVVGPPESYRKSLIFFAGRVLTDRKVSDPEMRIKYHGMARTSYRDALGMTDHASEPTLWATLWLNLGRLEIAAHKLTPTASRLAAASQAFDQADEVFGLAVHPWGYAAMHVARGELAAISAAAG